jgi:hypothetical protein
MRNAQIQVLSAPDNASQTGSQFDVGQIASASFAPVFGDTSAAGTLKIQCSNDLTNGVARNQFVPTNWCDIPNATSTIASGVGPAIVIGNMCFSYIRAVYTRSGGGTTTIVVNMNSIGV